MTQEVFKTAKSRVLRPGIIFSKIPFFLQWYPNDIALRCIRNSSINVLKKEPNQNQAILIISMISKDLNYLQDCSLDSVIQVITNSGRTFKTVHLQCVIAVSILKQQLTSSFTTPIIIVQGKPSFTRCIK